jgi:hypothetical protein
MRKEIFVRQIVRLSRSIAWLALRCTNRTFPHEKNAARIAGAYINESDGDLKPSVVRM